MVAERSVSRWRFIEK